MEGVKQIGECNRVYEKSIFLRKELLSLLEDEIMKKEENRDLVLWVSKLLEIVGIFVGNLVEYQSRIEKEEPEWNETVY